MTSRPVSAVGMTAAWIGVGLMNPILSMVATTSALRPRVEKVVSVVATGCCGIATVGIYRNTFT